MKCFSSLMPFRLAAFGLAALALTLSACSESQEYEYVDDTKGNDGKISLVVTDANGNNSSLPAGSLLGVYVTDDDGNITLLKAEVGQDGTVVLPADAQGRRMVAYTPYQEDWDDDALDAPQWFKVASDQTTEAAYTASDLMIGSTDGTSAMTFTHMLAQVVIHIVDETGANDFWQCGVTLWDMCDAVSVDLGSQTVTPLPASTASIKMLPYVVSDHRLSLKAIVAPQQKGEGERFVVFINNGFARRYAVPQVADMQGGKTYTLSMRLTTVGLELVGSSISDWNDGGEFSLDIH